MHKLLAKADLAILSGGIITWEKCVIGVPSLVTIKSQNQVDNTSILEKKGVHIITGYSKSTLPSTYSKKIDNIKLSQIINMKIKSKKICDGKGASRIVKIINAA